VIYSYPMIVDVVVGVMLFVGRHSLASRGYDEATVGSVLIYYGTGYCVSSLFMRHIVRRRQARWQMVAALLLSTLACGWLASTSSVAQIQLGFALVPVAFSLFFNAFQAFMLDVSDSQSKPLAATAGHYTFSWSLGFACGPFVSGASRLYLDWQSIYLVAGGVALGVALLVALVRPPPPPEAGARRASPVRQGARFSLIGPAWVGVVLAWAGWNALSTYWPVHAQQLAYGPGAKSAVEFVFALSQSLGALLLVYAGAWHHRPGRLPLFGAAGVAGLLMFAWAPGVAVFLLGAVLYGLYSCSAFILMVYHSMLDPQRAVGRVALNETFVGLSFLAGPVVARFLHSGSAPYSRAYAGLAVLLTVGVAVQTLYARRLLRRSAVVGAMPS
jgi:MFS family permease